MDTILSVKTAQAAEVAGVGYEGFRSWLKRGLLRETGVLPKSYAANAKAKLTDAKRWRWSAFGFADLCSFRLTKLMLDANLPWDLVSSVVSNEQLWSSHHRGNLDERYVAVFPKSNEFTIYSPQTLSADLESGIVRSDWLALFDLKEVRQQVVHRTRAATLRMVAEAVHQTSGIFAVTGGDLLSSSEADQRRLDVERLADRILDLSVGAEQGTGSYNDFEVQLRELHMLGKFPDNVAVSAVAVAFCQDAT